MFNLLFAPFIKKRIRDSLQDVIREQVNTFITALDKVITLTKSKRGAVKEDPFDTMVLNIDQFLTSVGIVETEEITDLGRGPRAPSPTMKEEYGGWSEGSQISAAKLPRVSSLALPWQSKSFNVPIANLRQRGTFRKSVLKL
jgi:hypothetical protein